MTGRLLLLALALTAALTAPALAGPKRHELIEPIQPDRRQTEAPPAACYCWTEHRINAAGLKTWATACSKTKPNRAARSATAQDCAKAKRPPKP